MMREKNWRSKPRKVVIPFSLTLTRSEVYPAFRSIIDGCVVSLKFLKIPIDSINIQSLSQDHCFAAANGLDYLGEKYFEEVISPTISILSKVKFFNI